MKNFIRGCMLLLATWGTSAAADPWEGSGHMWGGGHGMMAGGFLMMIMFWGIIITLIVLLVRWLVGKDQTSGPNPHDILKERLAKGEIDEDEYHRRKSVLDD